MRILSVSLIGFILLTSCEKDDTKVQDDIYYQEFEVEFPNYKNETLTYDIDGDMIDDLELKKEVVCKELDGEFEVNFKYKIATMQNKTDFLLFSPEGMLQKGQKIESGLYNQRGSNGDMISGWTVGKFDYSFSENAISEGELLDGIDKFYWGLKVFKNGNVHYGWLSLTPFDIEEIAINLKPDALIRVGQKE